MGDEEDEKPLRKIVKAFQDLASQSQTLDMDVEVAPFSRACSLISPLFASLGIAFKFAQMDYVAKVKDLAEASKSINTLEALIERDIEGNCVTDAGSHSRNLLRVKRGLDMVKVLFEQILVSHGNSLKGPASTAYAQVFAPYHGWAVRRAVTMGMYTLPTKAQLLSKLNENGGRRFSSTGSSSSLMCAANSWILEDRTLPTGSRAVDGIALPLPPFRFVFEVNARCKRTQLGFKCKRISQHPGLLYCT